MTVFAIGRGSLAQIGSKMRDVGLTGRAFLISDDQVFARYGASTEEGLRSGGFAVESYQLPAGEPTKTLGTTYKLYDWLVDHRAERVDAIVALGGGVVGDVAGFVAATFLRGMPLVQVPTNVLAQVDSSIGGKVGVNHPKGKNLIGAFHPARLILDDVETLRSLSRRDLAAGWAEAIKCALILDPELLDILEEHAEDLCDPDARGFRSDLLPTVIERCARHKIRIVEEDEREASLRMILNYGHTIGHGLEAALSYEVLLHGEAVSIGMAGVGTIAAGLGYLDAEAVRRQNAVLERFGLPTHFPPGASPPSVDAVLDGIAHDKKARSARINWILLDRIGHARIETAVPAALVRQAVANLLSEESTP